MLIALGIVLHFSLLAGRIVTSVPYIDECLYSLPSWNLAAHGSIAMPVLEPVHYTFTPAWTKVIPSIDKYWLCFMPLPVFTQAAWYKLLGYGLFSMRLFSVAWAAVALTACFFLVSGLTGDRTTAALAIVFIAVDEVFILGATMARMDMMSAALGFTGLSLYVNLREKHLNRALLAGNAFVVAAGLSHPNGGMLAFLGMMFLLALDRRRLTWRHSGLAIIPYLAGGIAMSAYISIDPAVFWAQFTGNSTGRLGAILSPLNALWREISKRYFGGFGGHSLSLKAYVRLYPS